METTDEMSSESDALDGLDEIEAEVATGPVVPVAGQVGVDPERMAVLIQRLRAAVIQAQQTPSDEEARRAALRAAEAQAALLAEEGRRKAQLLLDGARVAGLREEQVQAIIRESRQRGEVLVAEAYAYSQARLEEVLRRAEEARRLVVQAGEAVRLEHRAASRLAGAARRLVASRSSGRLASLVARLLGRVVG